MQLTSRRRLLTAGCSYTFYKWSTWADYLGKHFDLFYNKGIPGADNATIARSVTALAEPGDTVIAMWTSYQRHCWRVCYQDTYNYSAAHWGINSLSDKYYFSNIFNQYERFLTTLDYVQWVMADSVARNYNVLHYSAFPFLHGELETPVNEDMQQLLLEKKWIVEQIHPLSLAEFAINDAKIDEDIHPTSDSHFAFYKAVLCKNLNLDPMPQH